MSGAALAVAVWLAFALVGGLAVVGGFRQAWRSARALVRGHRLARLRAAATRGANARHAGLYASFRGPRGPCPGVVPGVRTVPDRSRAITVSDLGFGDTENDNDADETGGGK